LIGAEVIHAFENELAETLSDALLRRTMAGMGPKVGLDVDEAAAEIAAKHLGWSEERKQREIENYRQYIQRYRPKGTRRMKAEESRNNGGHEPVH
jgi:glycerol-3-phosphate dehydrogenase